MRRLTLIAAASLATLALHPTAHAQRRAPRQLVEEIQVEGNRRLSDEEIFAHVRTRPGDPFSPARVRRDLQTLHALPHFNKAATRVSTATGSRGGVVVVFTVHELPVIRDITFYGLRSVTEEEALKAVAAEGVGVGKETPFDPVRARKAEHAVRKLLAARGRPSATVVVEVEAISAVSVTLAFRVEEGEA